MVSGAGERVLGLSLWDPADGTANFGMRIVVRNVNLALDLQNG